MRDYSVAEVETMVRQPRWSPMIMQLLLCQQLRHAREQAGLSQAQAADQLGCSIKKLQYLETDLTASWRDLRALLKLYTVHPRHHDLIWRLWDLAHRTGWWDDDVHPARPSRRLKQVIGAEWGAQQLHVYAPMTIPVYLQTPSYAEAIYRDINREISPHESARVTAAWVDIAVRRAGLLRRHDAPRAVVLIDESALYCQVGGPQTLATQLDELHSLVDSPTTIEVRAVPYTASVPPVTLTTFALVSFDPTPDAWADVVNVNVDIPFSPTPVIEDSVCRSSDEHLVTYEEAFNRMRAAALDATGTRHVIERAQHYLAAARSTPA